MLRLRQPVQQTLVRVPRQHELKILAATLCQQEKASPDGGRDVSRCFRHETSASMYGRMNVWIRSARAAFVDGVRGRSGCCSRCALRIARSRNPTKSVSGTPPSTSRRPSVWLSSISSPTALFQYTNRATDSLSSRARQVSRSLRRADFQSALGRACLCWREHVPISGPTGLVERSLVAEVEEQGPGPEIGALGDLGERHRVVAARQKHLRRRVEKARPRRVLRFRPKTQGSSSRHDLWSSSPSRT